MDWPCPGARSPRPRRRSWALSAPSNVVSFTTASHAILRATGDATVVQSTALRSNEDENLSSGPNEVGCYFTWTVGPSGQALFHNCGGSALR